MPWCTCGNQEDNFPRFSLPQGLRDHIQMVSAAGTVNQLSSPAGSKAFTYKSATGPEIAGVFGSDTSGCK